MWGQDRYAFEIIFSIHRVKTKTGMYSKNKLRNPGRPPLPNKALINFTSRFGADERRGSHDRREIFREMTLPDYSLYRTAKLIYRRRQRPVVIRKRREKLAGDT